MIGTRSVRIGAMFVAAVLLALTLVGCGGVGAVSKSIADRVLPTSQNTVYAPCPEPGSYVDSYADASGTGTNYVYEVVAVTEDGEPLTVSLIFFGREASGEGWLEIEAKGTSGVHYQGVDEAEVPSAAFDEGDAREGD